MLRLNNDETRLYIDGKCYEASHFRAGVPNAIIAMAYFVWTNKRIIKDYSSVLAIKPDTEEYKITFASSTAGRVMTDVWDEVVKASSKHEPYNSPHEGHSVIREELDELWEHVKADTGRSPDAYNEAKQIAATAVRYMTDVAKKQ